MTETGTKRVVHYTGVLSVYDKELWRHEHVGPELDGDAVEYRWVPGPGIEEAVSAVLSALRTEASSWHDIEENEDTPDYFFRLESQAYPAPGHSGKIWNGMGDAWGVTVQNGRLDVDGLEIIVREDLPPASP